MAKEYIEPMKPIIEQIMSSIRTQQEDAIMRAVCDCGIVVDKERLVQALTDARSFYEEGYRAAMNAADVVEVVRCRECKHWHEATGWCYHHSHFIEYGEYGEGFCHPWESSDWKMFDADYFCADGERRTDDGNKENR